MAFGNLIRRLFNGPSSDPSQTAERARQQPVVNAPVTAAAGAVTPLAAPMACRDEIIDGRSRIAGYRFRARRPGGAGSAAAVAASLQQENLASFAERRLAVIPLAVEEWLAADFRQFIAAQTIFLLDPPPRSATLDQWLATLREMRAAGTRIGIDALTASSHVAALDLADLVLFDFTAYALPEFERLVKTLSTSHPQLALAADNVHSWPEHRLCQSLGLRYSLGGFAAEPDAGEHREQIDQSRLVLLEMLNLLRREADLGELTEVARRDPGLALKVLAMVNSPAAGLGRPVASIDQAILLLGRETLYRWLTVSMFRAGSGSPRDETLLELALCRARFLELTGLGLQAKPECDELFLVGMLSFLDSLLGMPLEQLLAKMRLPDNVVQALLHGAGPHRRHLMLAMAVERGREDLTARFANDLGLAVERVGECHAQALSWAENALQGT